MVATAGNDRFLWCVREELEATLLAKYGISPAMLDEASKDLVRRMLEVRAEDKHDLIAAKANEMIGRTK